MKNLENISKILSEQKAKKEYLKQSLSKNEKELKKIDIEKIKKALEIFQKISNSIQTEAVKNLGKIVTFCLDSIFPDEYIFQINFEQKRNKTEANINFKSKKGVESIDSIGGGVLDVLSFALRVTELILSDRRKLLILDEPFKFLSINHREKIAEMVEKISKDFGIQFIIITHAKELEIGKIIHLKG